MDIYKFFTYKGFEAENFPEALLVINLHQIAILKYTWLTRLISDVIGLVLSVISQIGLIIIFLLDIINNALFSFTGLTFRRIFYIGIAILILGVIQAIYEFIV